MEIVMIKRHPLTNRQCSSCKTTYGEIARAFRAHVKEGWSLFIGE